MARREGLENRLFSKIFHPVVFILTSHESFERLSRCDGGPWIHRVSGYYFIANTMYFGKLTMNQSDVVVFSEDFSSDFAVSYGSATKNFSTSSNSVFQMSAPSCGEIPSICFFFFNKSSLLQIIIFRVTCFPNLSKTFDNIFPLRDYNLIIF